MMDDYENKEKVETKNNLNEDNFRKKKSSQQQMQSLLEPVGKNINAVAKIQQSTKKILEPLQPMLQMQTNSSLMRDMYKRQIEASSSALIRKQIEEMSNILKKTFIKNFDTGVISEAARMMMREISEAIQRIKIPDISAEHKQEIIEAYKAWGIYGWTIDPEASIKALYQYYNSEKKDDVFAALKKNVKITKENIPAATQLFTPDWIVRYMVENSLGRLWLEGHPDVKDQLLPTEEEQSSYAAGNRDPEDTKWHYYLEEAEQESEVQAQLAEIRKEYAALTPDQLKVIDPCSGSGHILAYMFDVLMKIYESYGYTTREAVASIVENNLYGLDIDDRAAQLAYFAVMMKARQYDRRFFSRGIQSHVYTIVESNHVDKFAVDYFCNGDVKLTTVMDTIIKELHDAKEYGSILTVTPQDWSALYNRFAEITEDINMSRDTALRELLPLVQVAEALTQKYDVVVTNPPYMSSGNMGAKLLSKIKKEFDVGKNDTYSAFIIKCRDFAKKKGFYSMITMQGWMFTQRFEELRQLLLRDTLCSMLHVGYNSFPELNSKIAQTMYK